MGLPILEEVNILQPFYLMQLVKQPKVIYPKYYKQYKHLAWYMK